MDNRLKPYDDYRIVDLPWIDKIPLHWQCIRNKYLLTEINERSQYGLEELLRVSQYTGVTVRRFNEQKIGMHDAETLEGYKIVKRNDIVMNIMLAWNGSTGTSSYDGIVSPAYSVFRANTMVNPWFIHYMFRIPVVTNYFKAYSTGVILSRLRLYPEKLFMLTSTIPPIEEQHQIVKYLNWKLAKINKFITDKKKQIELLKEQKQAIINKAVTKGLDLNAKMKPSGIEWIGDIPEDWIVTQVDKAYNIELGKMLQPNKDKDNDTLEKYVCALNVFWDRIDTYNIKEMWFSNKDKIKYKLQKGDLIVVEGGDVAVSCIWNGDIEACYIQNAVHRVREKGYGTNKFLYYWLKSLKDLGYIDMICNKATLAHFTKEKFSRLFIVLPPFNEQQKIVNHIELKTEIIDNAIRKIHKELEFVLEYKTSLISDVVTGKVDVRGMKIGVVDELIEDFDEIDEDMMVEKEMEIVEEG